MIDYKQLCAELVDAIDSGIPTDRMHLSPLMLRTRAALAKPEPEGPTDEELDELAWNWYSKTGSTWYQIDAFRAYARAVLARWGNHPGSPDSSTQPS
jgi:hypothetical protein